MHVALQIHEVVDLICGEIAADGPERWHSVLPVIDYPSRCEDLARLARTCTSFFGPALDALWSHQGTLIHLLRTIPEDLWDIIETTHIHNEYEPGSLEIISKRAATADDWTRFLFYSRRVRSFKDTRIYLPTSNVYDVLATSFPGGFIFPRLESLDWYPNAQTLGRCARLFLSPEITRLRLKTSCFTDQRLLPKLMTTFRALKHVEIHGCGHVAEVSRFICAQPDLETLVVNELAVAAFAHIARFASLRVLRLPSKNFSHLPTAPSGLPLFPTLDTLECESLTSGPQLLEWTGSSLLEFKLTAKSWGSIPVKGDFRDLYSAIASHCRPENLHEISIGKPRVKAHAQHVSHYLVSVEELRPLFAFQNLVFVSLDHSPCVDLDDAGAAELARSWPFLQELHFHSDTSPRITPRLTLEGVAAFAESCPELEVLTILFDATVVPKLKVRTSMLKRKTNRTEQFSLEQLHVAYSPVSPKPQRVAEFLRTIFPFLRHILTACPDEREARQDAQLMSSAKGWNRVQDAL
ncbi:hypothetical protein FB45DRAFT_1035777 [Roridomyces roridus]|uniref:F-box domain-containing protein n=1 Tax=Roridomyces roridus TaxID=1738132 RepID=A0AAD7BAU5_9AGAR|nr:hypothetical protein FB45DRAFT_1035777 [Roridomyces roridus]